MKKSQLLDELVSYDLKKGWKPKHNGDAPVVRELKAFLSTRLDLNDTVIPFAEFSSYLQTQGLAALVAEQALAGKKSLSKALIRKWIEAEKLPDPYLIPPPAVAFPPQDASAPVNHLLAGDLVPAPAAFAPKESQNNHPMFGLGSKDFWRNAMPKHLGLRAIYRLIQTCRFFQGIYQQDFQQGHNAIIRPLLPRPHDEYTLRERLEHLVKISDDLRDAEGRFFWSEKPAMEEAKALVLACKVANPHLNLFYKQGLLQTRGLPPLYLAASRSNRELWQWLLLQLLEQVPEAERSQVSAIAHLQWHATNCDVEATRALLAEHPDLVLAKNPLLTWNCTPLYIAASLQYKDIYDLLVSQAPPEYAPVCELMWLVITGQQDANGNYEAANTIENIPELMLMRGIEGKSPWQIACAHYDTRLMKALLVKLPAEYHKEALRQQEEVDENDWHISPAPFFKAYQAFIDGFDAWYENDDWDAIEPAWNRIGDEFRRIPQHMQALFFQAYPLDPLPDFKKVAFQRACVSGNGNNLFPITPAAGPGFEFSVCRSNWRTPISCGSGDGWPAEGRVACWVLADLLAHKALLVRCQEKYREIKQSLQDNVAQIKAAPSPCPS